MVYGVCIVFFVLVRTPARLLFAMVVVGVLVVVTIIGWPALVVQVIVLQSQC